MEAARRSLIARVEELACEREELRTELGELQKAQGAAETRVKELEAALKRAQTEADETPRGESDDADLPAAQRKRFTRAEMSRVITERNLYKERLMELQEAVRRSERMRALKEQRSPQTGKSSIWERFNRLLGLSSDPPLKALSSHSAVGTLGPDPGYRSVPPADLSHHLRRGSVKSFGSNDSETSVESAKGQRRERYRLIRAHVWKEHGRSQAHGWSLPPKEAGETPRGGPRGPLAVPVPALVQVRLLDQKDPSTKLWCATGVQLCERDLQHLRLTAADSSTEPRGKALDYPPSMVWICSGTHSETEVMVIDVSKANHVLDHFTIANCHVLCSTSVPGNPGR
ncbi:C-Jun-amino-terminal kinase-interacting protein 4-like, partial [Heptranchias perlo]|uniref:C-Jun-amino-terminal kinase-interacting protein 4-like n=1 Tax=Heptranchias perlo TaxID=212740 RepID=UPI003559F107